MIIVCGGTMANTVRVFTAIARIGRASLAQLFKIKLD